MFINRSDLVVVIYVVIIIKLFSITSALISTTTKSTAANMKIQPLNAAAKAVLWDVGINLNNKIFPINCML